MPLQLTIFGELMAARRRSSIVRSPKRRLFWARTRVNHSITGTTDLVFIDDLLATFQAAYDADLFGFTITRIRGNLATRTVSATTTAGTAQMTAGIRVDDQNAVTVIDTDAEQITQMPTGDPHADWMWTRNWAVEYPSTTALAAGAQSLWSFDFDIKAQRRLDELGQSLYLFSGRESATENTAVSLMSWDFSILCKRP